jgi:hypothetical protein
MHPTEQRHKNGSRPGIKIYAWCRALDAVLTVVALGLIAYIVI